MVRGRIAGGSVEQSGRPRRLFGQSCNSRPFSKSLPCRCRTYRTTRHWHRRSRTSIHPRRGCCFHRRRFRFRRAGVYHTPRRRHRSSRSRECTQGTATAGKARRPGRLRRPRRRSSRRCQVRGASCRDPRSSPGAGGRVAPSRESTLRSRAPAPRGLAYL